MFLSNHVKANFFIVRVLKSSNNKQIGIFSESRRHLQRIQSYAELMPFASYIVKNCLYNQAFNGYLLLYEFPTLGHKRLFMRSYGMHVRKVKALFTERQLSERAASRARKRYRKHRKTKIKARHYARVKYRIKTRVRRPLLEGAATIELYDLARHYARMAAIKDLI